MALVELPVAAVWKAQGGKEALSAFSWDGWGDMIYPLVNQQFNGI